MAYLRSLYHWVFGFAMATFWILLIGIVSLFVPTRRYHKLWKRGFGMITSAFGLKIVVTGLENVPDKNVLYMPHHVNSFEPFIAMPSMPQWCVAVEKEENFRVPIYSILIKNWGNIPIDRKNRERAKQQLGVIKQLLAEGTAVAIMPEGTRSRDGKLLPFKKGGFHIALDCQAMIVPFVYKNLYDFNHHGSFLLHPRTVEVIFTPAIDTREYDESTMPQLINRVRRQILDALGETEDPNPAPLLPPEAPERAAPAQGA